LDQKWFRVRSERGGLKCWTKGRDDLLERAKQRINEEVRVVGRQFTVRRRKMVVVEDIQ